MKKTLLLLITLFSISCYSQFSKTHYIPPLTCATNLAGDQYLYISTPSTSNVNFKILANDGSITSGVVKNTDPYIYSIGQGTDTQLFIPKTNTGIVTTKGFIVEAEDLIYVSVRVNAGFSTFNNSYNHAGGLVSKGNSALGKEFRLGAMLNPLFDPNVLNFASILSTENNTKVTISNIETGTILLNGNIISGPFEVTLNKNESYVLALENTSNTISNSSKMIGALVESDKPVVVNSGSFGGSNSSILNAQGNVPGRDVGFDQIVPTEKTGMEYIFVKGLGTNELERVLLIANEDDTKIFINDSTVEIATLSKGQYTVLDGGQFIDGNLYVSTSKNVSAYQSIGGNATPANQNLFFVPPLNCATPNIVDNIPAIQSIGNTLYNGGLNIVTETNATVTINGSPINATDAIPVTGNTNYVRYTLFNQAGNIAVKSTKQVYVSYFGTNGAATYGGYYSGFDTKPEIVTDKITATNSACIPNVVLKISTLSSYDTFQWYFNDEPINGANSNSYKPIQPGYYQVKGTITSCSNTDPIFSDKIPVSNCPLDSDNDGSNNNIDIDLDNDGITNCTESYGDQNLNLLNPTTGTISVGSYSNSFTGTVTTFGTGLPMGTFTGNTNGSFITEVPAGKGNSVTYKLNFARPMSVGVEYTSTANPTDLLNANAEFIVISDIDKTITVLNPNNQLLIDTNYDGIYESGITQYSSFEIRFRLNSTTALAAGTGTFKFLTHLTNAISFTHKNLSDDISNKATLKFFATCVPKDSDGDGNPDQLDTDSDNDGISDTIEAQQNISVNFSNSDTNNNGLDNAFEPGFIPYDNDNDGIYDYLDLDSDNDGILDLEETGVDTDTDGIRNYRDLDSDNDLCNDVNEAGFSDPDNDGKFGNSPISVDSKGLVIGAPYTIPNPDYLISAPIIISKQPAVASTCELQNAEITLVDNGGNTYQWQLLTSGIWTDIIDGSTYSGGKTNTLLITRVKNEMNGNKYRVKLEKNGNSCGLISSETTLTIYALPVVSPITIVQCDDDTDGFSDFNLTIKNNEISSNAAAETFTYYTSLAGAEKRDSSLLIPNPTAFRNTVSGNMKVWANIENENGCNSIAEITLIVSTTKIPASFSRSFSICDDLGAANNDTDGIATFDFSSVTAEIEAILPASTIPYSIKYYKNEPDALSESDEITNTSNYRNEGYPNEQKIWVRVESTVDNACYGLSPRITLTVNPKPNIDTNADSDENELVCSNLPTFFVTLDAGIQDGTPSTDYTYVWTKDNVILTSETNSTLNVNTEGNYTVEVSSLAGCSRIRNIKVTASDIAQITNILIVDLSDVNSITVNVTGKGKYQYSLDAPSGPFQDSNFFDNVTAGIHEIYINDKNGCGTVSKTIAVIGIPKFFTPNGDGYNDYWNVKGVNENFNKNSIIYIFDRYGKLLKQIVPSSQGWDGTFLGQPLSADDYWYSIKLVDGREVKGHFSLKR
ncbi:T9SS type B sorting domain-containing protein [Flavobacterium glaciei]|uniref:Gliding motility-associated-like protein n=1 Tax=Flavobacterium glaciei TaxID=386300 RepID=A0A562Q1Q5_9FLAO|nr:T9SS type B sorting domain-containing protein [Flavobacterium glaciei]RDI57569.1 gliding motility-associated-like protein [Flavobacterium glaciei]TWI50631.1 gliding motility-associated-like protein [Flavobacterium glaciei]